MSTLVADALLVLGLLNLGLGALSLLSSGRKTLSRPLPGPSAREPKVALLVPCCGDEPGLEKNLEALMSQTFASYRAVFVVEAADDAAVPAIERCLARHPGQGTLVTAGPAARQSQKIHNLLAAVAAAPPETEVLAFADSDGRPRPDWLEHLVNGLSRPGADEGAASSYRFYVPSPLRFTTLLRSVWNLAVASLLGDHDRNFAWGGAIAIRRETFERARVAEAWRGALSDDYALTNAVRAAGGRIHYVPEATVPSYGDVGLRELLDWTTRQIQITRVYWPRLFRLAAMSHLAYAAFVLLAPLAGTRGLVLLGAVLAVSAASGARRAADEPLVRMSHRWAYALLVPLASLVTAQGVVRALVSRRIWWRGKLYEMRSPGETVLVATRAETAPRTTSSI